MFNVSYIIKAFDGFTPVTRAISASIKDLDQKTAAINKRFSKSNTGLRDFGTTLRGIGGDLTGKVTAPIALAGAAAVKFASDVETAKMQFSVLTGSAEKGSKLFQDLYTFAAKTPFEMPGVTEAARVLLSAGYSIDQILPMMKNLGDVAAGTDGNLAGLAMVMMQIKANNRMSSQDMNQILGRGIKLLDFFEKKTGMASEQIRKAAEEGRIPAASIERMFKEMAGAGGQFDNMASKLGETTDGKFSTMADSIRMAMAEIGQEMVDTLGLKGWFDAIGNAAGRLAVWFKNLTPTSKKLIFGLALLAAAVGPVLLVIGALIPLLLDLGAAFSFAFGPVGVAVMALGSLYVLLKSFSTSDMGRKIADNVFGYIDWVIAKIKLLINVLFSAYETFDRFKRLDFAGAKASFQSTLKMGADFFGVNSTQTDVNVNLNAPPGVVRSVDSRTSSRGGTPANVGVFVGAP